ncbi:unnamed protein product [Trifolium pratense]|uniref:Uncharacterized protein n=1 Tax=Trifolium pratense TaxID=57577 RepID=A0ACB0K3T6_TRIPR|nr:unnamed protein product [Trifolium pratense]
MRCKEERSRHIWNDVLVTVLVEMHMKQGHISCAHGVVVWKALIGMYGRKGECEYAFEMIFFYSSVLTRQWDPGKFNVFLSKAAYEFCWRIVFISHGACIHIVVEPYDLALWNTVIWGLLNFVFDRGKLDGCKISTLRTRLFEGVGIDRDLTVKVGLDFGPRLRCDEVA